MNAHEVLSLVHRFIVTSSGVQHVKAHRRANAYTRLPPFTRSSAEALRLTCKFELLADIAPRRRRLRSRSKKES